MVTSLIAFCLLSLVVTNNACSILVPTDGSLYIANVQLLNQQYPDSVLLTFARTPSNTLTFPSDPSITVPTTTVDNGPWCKVMNVLNGDVGDVVECADYATLVRDWTSVDVNANTEDVQCYDNCDGASATCTILQSGRITFSIADVPYLNSQIQCLSTDPTDNALLGVIWFDIGSTLYIKFASDDDVVGVQSDLSTTPPAVTLLSVAAAGDWSSMTTWFDTLSTGVYSTVSVLQRELPCCLCDGYTLLQYSVTSDPSGDYDEILTLDAVGFNGGFVDSVTQRAIKWGPYGQSVRVYDLSGTGSLTTLEPDLCPGYVDCLMSPCLNAECPYDANARCVEDYCGACTARWFCGSVEITDLCSSTSVTWNNNPINCPTTEEPTTEEPTTEEPTTSEEFESTTGAGTTEEPTTSDAEATDAQTTDADTETTNAVTETTNDETETTNDNDETETTNDETETTDADTTDHDLETTETDAATTQAGMVTEADTTEAETTEGGSVDGPIGSFAARLFLNPKVAFVVILITALSIF